MGDRGPLASASLRNFLFFFFISLVMMLESGHSHGKVRRCEAGGGDFLLCPHSRYESRSVMLVGTRLLLDPFSSYVVAKEKKKERGGLEGRGL